MDVRQKFTLQSPGFSRLKKRMGEEAFEALRQDTLRMQSEALSNVRGKTKLTKDEEADLQVIRDTIKGKR